MIKFIGVFLIILQSSLFASDDFSDFSDFLDIAPSVKPKEESTVFFCDRSSDIAIKVPIEINSDGNFSKCLNSKLNEADNYKPRQNSEMYIPKLNNFQITSEANCNCYPKNKLDEFLMSEYGAKKVEEEKKLIKEKMKTAYISNLRNTLLDVMDFEVFLNQNGKQVREDFLVNFKNCNINRYSDEISKVVDRVCGVNYKGNIESDIKQIMPTYLEDKMTSFLKREPLKNSCMTYQTYKNTQVANEYKTLYGLMSNISMAQGSITAFKRESLDRAFNEDKFTTYSAFNDIENSISGSFLIRYYLNNKEKFSELDSSLLGSPMIQNKNLKKFSDDVNKIMLKDETLLSIAKEVGERCNLGVSQKIIKAAFCPSDNEIPNSLLDALPANNALKINEKCRPDEDVLDDDFGIEDNDKSITSDEDVEEYYNPETNFFSSKNALKRAIEPKKNVSDVLCSGKENVFDNIKKNKEEAIKQNLAFVGLSYGVCFKTLDECKAHGYTSKYSNDGTDLEKFCSVTTAPDCEKKLGYVEKYINNDETLPPRVREFLTQSLEAYKASPALITENDGKEIKTKSLPSGLDYSEIEGSLEIMQERMKISSSEAEPTLSSEGEEPTINTAPTSIGDIKPMDGPKALSPLDVFEAGTQKSAPPSSLADYALKGDVSDYQRIEEYEKNPNDASIGSIYSRKIPIEASEPVTPTTKPVAPITTVTPDTAETGTSSINDQVEEVKPSTTKVSSTGREKTSSRNITPKSETSITQNTTNIKNETNNKTNNTQNKSTSSSDRHSSDDESSSKDMRDLEKSMKEVRDLQDKLERDAISNNTSSSSTSSALRDSINEKQQRINDLANNLNDVANRAINTANTASRSLDRASNNLSNNWANNSATSNNWASSNNDVNQSVAPSSLQNIDDQAEQIADDMKKAGASGELGGGGEGGGSRSPASSGGGALGGSGALGGASSGGLGGPMGLVSNQWLDKIKFDETQFKKIIEDSYFKNESNKEDLLKALNLIGFKVLTIEEKKIDDKNIEYTIREYDLELSDNLKKFFGVEDLSTMKNREIVNKKFIEILKDEEKYMEIISEIMEKFVVKDEKKFKDKGKGLAYKGSIITKNEISESIKKFYKL